MKKLLCTACVLTMCLFNASAQSDVKRELADSIAARLCGRMCGDAGILSDAFETLGLAQDKRLSFETAFFLTYSELFSSLSEEELRQELKGLDHPLFQWMTSSDCMTSFTGNMTDALLYEMGQNPEFTYQFKDKKFGGLLEMTEELFSSVIEEKTGELKASMANYSPVMQESVSRVIKHIPELLFKSMGDYFSYEQIHQWFQDRQHNDYMSGEAQMLDDSLIMAKIPDIMSLTMSGVPHNEICRYVSLSRSQPRVHLEKYPFAEVKSKKYAYSGQTTCGIPHGYGTMTDKKGVVYKGDFRNGKRHGLIEVTKPGAEPVLQVWVGDKYQKGVPVGPDADGTVPNAVVYDGKAFGYGRVYDYKSGVTCEGYFVDGVLNGKGKMISTESVSEGDFVDGELRNGTMKFNGSEWKLNVLRGQFHGSEVVGQMRYINADGSLDKTFVGNIVNGLLEGKGMVKEVGLGYRFALDGTFAYGHAYGPGKLLISSEDTTGFSEKTVYEGMLYRDQPHGHGHAEIHWTGVEKGIVENRRFGVYIKKTSTDSEWSIVADGEFENGSLVRGKVVTSDGAVMDGTFNGGRLTGHLVKKYSDGTEYDGECVDGLYHGHGRIRYTDGTVYEGEFENGQTKSDVTRKAKYKESDPYSDESWDRIDAMSEYLQKHATLPPGSKVHRSFKNLPVEKGKVRVVRASGVEIMVRGVSSVEVDCIGEFDRFNRLLNGKVIISDGNWMEGTFEDGILVKGRARQLDKYGTIYVGDIKNGYPHGKGECTYKDGTRFVGRFANGNRMEGTHYAADGKVIKVYK